MSLVFIIMQSCVCVDVLADGIWSEQKTAKVNILDALQVCLQLRACIK